MLRRAADDSTDAPKIHSHFRQINISIQTVCIAFSERNSRAAAALHRFWGGNVFILAAAVEAIKRITWTDEAIMKPSQCGEREGRRVYSPLVRPPQALKAFSRAAYLSIRRRRINDRMFEGRGIFRQGKLRLWQSLYYRLHGVKSLRIYATNSSARKRRCRRRIWRRIQSLFSHDIM